MNKPEKKWPNKYERLTRLSTSELEELIKVDAASACAERDNDLINCAMEVILKREKEAPTNHIMDVKEAWSVFQQYYNTPDGEGMSLYLTEDDEHDSVRSGYETVSAGQVREPNITHSRRWLKNSLIAAAAIIALLVGMVGAQAAGIDVFGAIGRWTEETFHFVTSTSGAVQGNTDITPSAEPTSYYDTLQEALEECGISEKLTPMWYPQGLEMSDPIISSGDFGNKIFCEYKGLDDKFCNIQIWRYDLTSDLDLYTFEKDGSNVEKYTSGEKSFYIMSNIGTSTATWSDGHSLVLSIAGNILEDDIKAMIDSIGG